MCRVKDCQFGVSPVSYSDGSYGIRTCRLRCIEVKEKLCGHAVDITIYIYLSSYTQCHTLSRTF